MKKHIIVLFIFLLLNIAGIGSVMADDIEKLIFSDDETEIFNIVINDIMNVILIPKNETILINRNMDLSKSNVSTDLPQSQRDRYINNISDELWYSLHSYNVKKYIFDPETKFDVKRNYRLVNISDNDKKGNLKRGEGYPLLSFTKIGFNGDKTEAILEVNYFFPRAGSGFIVYLKKENDSWGIINRIMAWVS